MNVVAAVRAMVGERNLGRLDYLLRPRLRNTWGGPFNGQDRRREIFVEIVRVTRRQALIETGTYLGTTTAFMATLGLPVFTVESNARFHAFSAWRLRPYRHSVQLFYGDSREFLRCLDHGSRFPGRGALFYLDAHWYSHLPLLEELQIIFDRWSDSIVMVDDFCVPGTAYGYDDYGPGQILNLEYLKPLKRLDLAAFMPAVGPESETGAKRGCVILCRRGTETDAATGEVTGLAPVQTV